MRRSLAAVVCLAACAPVELTVGLGPHALGFDGDACAVGSGGAVGVGDALTVEAWVRGADAPAADHGAILSFAGVSLWTSAEATGLSSPTDPPDDGWRTPVGLYDGRLHHVAAVWTREDGAWMFIDGVRSGRGAPIGSFPPIATDELLIGCSPDALPGFDGVIDEVRVSSVARYVRNFPTQTAPYAADGATVSLHHLDLGLGDLSPDAAEHFPVRLDGAAWTGPLILDAQAPTD